MHRLLNGGRSHPAANMNKPLPEPLVDPDEGKTPIGELVIVPIQGRDLPNRERFGKQDPFILFKLGNVSKRSSTDVRGGQRPRWKDDQLNIFMYESDAKDATSLYVTCLDEDPQKNDLIGDCVINLARVLELGEQDDWFELSYKGREAGQLMLQLTYYSYDPKNPTNKMNRVPTTPIPGAPARRPIHPTKETKKVDEKPVEDENRDEGPVYQPPVVPEPPAAAIPIVPVAGYPYGTMPAGGMGRPVSPSGQGHYGGHHTPQAPPTNPYGVPAAISPVSPYSTNPAAYAGYSTPVVPTAYQDPSLAGADPSKRLSFTGQPLQPGGFLPTGYPPVAAVVPGYPSQVPVVPSAVPPVGAYPPHSPGFPPQNSAYVTGASPYGQAPALSITPVLPNGGGPPAGYPFAAPGIYPPANNNNGPGPVGSGGYPAAGPINNGFPGAYPGNNNNNNNIGGSNHPYGSNGGMNSHSTGNVNNMNNAGFNNNTGNNNTKSVFNGNNGGNGVNNNNSFNNNNGGPNNFNNGHNFNSGNGFNANNNNGNNMSNFNNNSGNNFNGNNNNGNNNNNNNNSGNNFNNNGNNGNNFNNNFNNNNNGSNFNNNNNFNNGSSFNNNNNNGGGYPSVTPKKTTTISSSPAVRSAESMYRPDEF